MDGEFAQVKVTRSEDVPVGKPEFSFEWLGDPSLPFQCLREWEEDLIPRLPAEWKVQRIGIHPVTGYAVYQRGDVERPQEVAAA